jgi:hypothetical protein
MRRRPGGPFSLAVIRSRAGAVRAAMLARTAVEAGSGIGVAFREPTTIKPASLAAALSISTMPEAEASKCAQARTVRLGVAFPPAGGGGWKPNPVVPTR